MIGLFWTVRRFVVAPLTALIAGALTGSPAARRFARPPVLLVLASLAAIGVAMRGLASEDGGLRAGRCSLAERSIFVGIQFLKAIVAHRSACDSECSRTARTAGWPRTALSGSTCGSSPPRTGPGGGGSGRPLPQGLALPAQRRARRPAATGPRAGRSRRSRSTTGWRGGDRAGGASLAGQRPRAAERVAEPDRQG